MLETEHVAKMSQDSGATGVQNSVESLLLSAAIVPETGIET